MTPRVQQYVAEEAASSGVSATDILSRNRRHDVAHARRRVAVRLYNDGFSHSQIARWMGLDPSTVHFYMQGKAAARRLQA